MAVPADPPIFHITHIKNLPGILRAGCLYSDSHRLRTSLPVTNIGYSHIKGRRLRKQVTVAGGGTLGDYVPFYFCPRSVMLYVIHRGHKDYGGGQNPIVHLVSSVQAAIATGRPWAFTDRHAELGHAEFFDNLAQLDQVDWAVMPKKYWKDPPITQELRQAEFLVLNWFRFDAVREIAVVDETMAGQVRSLLAGSTHQPAVHVRREWYY